ncbi:unnamed protein product, partial [Chrysoparadoxa australica]
MANQSYISLTMHYIDESFNMKACSMGVMHMPEAHTAEAYSKKLKEFIKKFVPLERVIGLTTDGASNMVAMEQYLPFPRRTCFCHVINNVTSELFRKLKKGVSEQRAPTTRFFKKSSTALEELKAAQQLVNGKKLVPVQEVSTRWHSVLDMAERWLLLKQALFAYSNAKRAANKNKNCPNKYVDALTSKQSDADWASLYFLVQVLRPFKKIQQFSEGEQYPAIGMVPIMSLGLWNK